MTADDCGRSPFEEPSKVLKLFATLLASILIVGCAASESKLSITPTTASHEVLFKMGRSCFSGSQESYDDWAASVVSKNEDSGLAIFHARFPESEYETYKNGLDCHFIAYPVGELTVRGIYVHPKGHEGEDLPVLIVNRGGNGSSGAWNFGRMFQRVLPLAKAGFIVIGSQYRGSRQGDDPSIYGSDEFGGKDVDDVLALFQLVDHLPGADEDRIGMYGWSRGGMMALLVATMTDRLRAVAVGGTPTDLAAELVVRPEMERVFRARIPNYDENKDAVLEARSAVHWAHKMDTDLPVLILHGRLDERVSVNSAQQLAEMLEELNRPHKLVVFETGSHGLLAQNKEVVGELVEWFRTHL